MILFKFSNEAEGMATGWRRKHKVNVMSASSMTWEGGGPRQDVSRHVSWVPPPQVSGPPSLAPPPCHRPAKKLAAPAGGLPNS